MKKFLTVLLALSVVFTYSFSSVGAVFAAEYTLDDYAQALTAEKSAQLNYLTSAKNQAVGSYTYDEDGFTEIDGVKYMKAALEAAADEVISDLTKEMDAEINNVLNGTFPTSVAPDASVAAIRTIGDKAATKALMTAELAKKTETLNKTQAPLTKAFVEGKLVVDLSKYNSTDKKYDVDYNAGSDLTAAQAVQKAIDIATEKIAAAAKETTDAAKISGYMNAYTEFKAAMDKIKTIADEEFESGINAGTVEAAVELYAKEALDAIATALNINPNMAADDVENWKSTATGTLNAFWEADKTNVNKGEFFGVAIANIEKVTRTEVAAVNAAYKAAVASAKAPIKSYADGKVSAVTDLIAEIKDQSKFDSLANAMEAADVYADVVAAGEKMKATYEFGVKKYDDAKVEQAVKAAEALVYADIKDGFKAKPADYIEAAANNEGITLDAENYELQRFNKAVEDAAKKMYKDGTKATVVQVKVSYGDGKTAEADLVYLQGTYYVTDAAVKADWEKIAKAAIDDLKAAQSYDEINAIMAQAAEDFGKLLKADGAQDVITARASYVKALNDYGTLKKGLLEDKDYPDANVDAAVAQGEKLINKATTVDAVKAAYEEAKALVDALKTADELKAAKEAVEKQIAALPYTSQLTVADKAAVRAAYEAYDAYMNMAGAADIAAASKALLQEKYDKVNELEAKAIEEKAEALNKQLAKLTGSDVDIAAKAALKADVDAVLAEAKALEDEIDDVNENYTGFLKVVSLDEADDLEDVDMMGAVAEDAYIKLVKAAKEGATVEEMKEALAAYNALTDKQKYSIDASALQFAKIIEKRLNDIAISSVESLKISVSTKLYKGSKIRVNWKIKGGDASYADGYQVWKSKKAQSGYTIMGKTTKSYMDNKKGLKKGTRMYYKVRAYVEIDGVKYYSDWSNKGNRIYK